MPREQLRIAMFSDSALPILNGVSVSIEALIASLRDRGHSVHLFTARYPGYRDAEPNTYRFRAIETPWTKGYPLAFPPFLRALRKFRRHEFDLIHTHTPFTIGFVGLRWAESHELPVVGTYHTLYDRYAHYIPVFPRRYVRFKIAKHTNFFYNKLDHVIAPSEAAVRWLKRHSVAAPMSVIPTSLAPPKMISRQEARQRLGIGSNSKVMLYVGRVAREKNIDLLLRAAKIVCERDQHARLWVVGDGPYRADCARASTQLGIGDRVKFVGFVPRAEVDAYYAAADLFAFPSYTETQGLVVQEAMVYGLPAVVVAGGGAEESVEPYKSGLVSRDDPAGFAELVLNILSDDRLAASLSEGAKDKVRRLIGDSSVEAVESVYHAVLEKNVRVAAHKVSLV